MCGAPRACTLVHAHNCARSSRCARSRAPARLQCSLAPPRILNHFYMPTVPSSALGFTIARGHAGSAHGSTGDTDSAPRRPHPGPAPTRSPVLASPAHTLIKVDSTSTGCSLNYTTLFSDTRTTFRPVRLADRCDRMLSPEKHGGGVSTAGRTGSSPAKKGTVNARWTEKLFLNFAAAGAFGDERLTPAVFQARFWRACVQSCAGLCCATRWRACCCRLLNPKPST